MASFSEIPATNPSANVVFDERLMARYGQSGPRKALEAQGLLELTQTQLKLTATGRLLRRTVAMTFDAYLSSLGEAQPMSRVV